MINPTCHFFDILPLIQEILMHLWCKTSQNIWPLFSKYLPLHHLTPEWWNGRHEGLKIPWPLRLYEFESRFRHFPSVELLSRREFFCCSYTPLYVYGVILPQRGKKQRKTDILFCRYVEIDMPTLQNDCIWSSRTCAYVRAPSNSDVVFLLSQVSHAEKKGTKNSRKFSPNRSLDPE